MTWLAWSLVIFLTALATMLGTAWWTGRGCVATEQPRERKRSGGNENADRWLPRAGRLPVTFQGAADPAQQLQPFDPLKVLADALTIAERHLSQAEVARDLAAIELEVELNPERWR